MEIGAGYSNIPLEALKAGVLKYTANDLSQEHLQILKHRVNTSIDKKVLKNLSLHHGKAPEDLPKVKNKYDAILAE